MDQHEGSTDNPAANGDEQHSDKHQPETHQQQSAAKASSTTSELPNSRAGNTALVTRNNRNKFGASHAPYSGGGSPRSGGGSSTAAELSPRTGQDHGCSNSSQPTEGRDGLFDHENSKMREMAQVSPISQP